MVEIKLKEKSNFKSINGNDLKLYIHKMSTCLRIIIINNQQNIHKKCIILFITAIFNSFLLLFNLVTINVILGILFIILVFLYSVCKTTVEESLLVVQDLGIEITKKNVIGMNKAFYPFEQIQRIFINEVIFSGKVIFVMAIIINDLNQDKLVPLFMDLLPQLALVKIVYNQIRHQIP